MLSAEDTEMLQEEGTKKRKKNLDQEYRETFSWNEEEDKGLTMKKGMSWFTVWNYRQLTRGVGAAQYFRTTGQEHIANPGLLLKDLRKHGMIKESTCNFAYWSRQIKLPRNYVFSGISLESPQM
jgi:hypothetical protein